MYLINICLLNYRKNVKLKNHLISFPQLQLLPLYLTLCSSDIKYLTFHRTNSHFTHFFFLAWHMLLAITVKPFLTFSASSFCKIHPKCFLQYELFYNTPNIEIAAQYMHRGVLLQKSRISTNSGLHGGGVGTGSEKGPVRVSGLCSSWCVLTSKSRSVSSNSRINFPARIVKLGYTRNCWHLGISRGTNSRKKEQKTLNQIPTNRIHFLGVSD